MPQSLSNILVHLVFSAKDRVPSLDSSLRARLGPYLSATLRNIGCPPLQVGGATDRVHLLFRLARTTTVADVVEVVKTSSSKWIKRNRRDLVSHRWQKGYGAFSISEAEAGRVVTYIKNQEAHHRVIRYEDEYEDLLERYDVEYDERYVWD